MSLRSESGDGLDIYELESMTRTDAGWDIEFSRILDRMVFRVRLSRAQLRLAELVESDLRDAPSFVAPRSVPGQPTRKVEFICERLKRIVAIELPKI